MNLKFEKVGHSIYVLLDDMAVGRIKVRYDFKPYFESFKDYPLHKEQVKQILEKLEEVDK